MVHERSAKGRGGQGCLHPGLGAEETRIQPYWVGRGRNLGMRVQDHGSLNSQVRPFLFHHPLLEPEDGQSFRPSKGGGNSGSLDSSRPLAALQEQAPGVAAGSKAPRRC